MNREPKRRPVQNTGEADGIGDSPEYLREWARALVKTAGKREARVALAEYKRLATDKAVPKAEQKSAAARAKAIEKNL